MTEGGLFIKVKDTSSVWGFIRAMEWATKRETKDGGHYLHFASEEDKESCRKQMIADKVYFVEAIV